MKTNTKRITALFLAILMIFSTLPILTASAANVAKSGKFNKNVSWTLYTSGKLVVSGKGSTGTTKLSIDDLLNIAEMPLLEISDKIKTAEIKDGVTNICWGMFFGCEKLKSITIAKSVKKIGDSAFAFCSKLEEINIPNGVTEIGDSVFWLCGKLKTATLPSSLTKIGYDIFSDCTSLQQITVAKKNTKFASVNGILYNKDKTEVLKCPQAIKEIKLAKGVKKIGDSAFEGCKNLKEITIPNTVTKIGECAFMGCGKLTKISIPKSVTNIGSLAFSETAYSNNPKNTQDGLLYIGDCLIEGAPASSTCNIKSGTRVIADNALLFAEINQIIIPESVTHIGKAAFAGCDIKSITIPAGVVSIGAFGTCAKLEEINVDSKNKKYSSANGILYNKNKTTLIYCPNGKKSATIPNSVTKIGKEAFASSNLSKISIPNGVTSIGSSAFAYCDKLTSVTISKSVTSIGKDAFTGCNRLSEIKVNSNNKKYASVNGVLYNKNKTTLIKCPATKTEITIPKTVTKIEAFAFEDCSRLKTVTVPKNVKNIGDCAFIDCTRLKSIKIYNADCKIYNSWLTINEGTTIYGYKNSTAEAYAKKYDFKFKKL